MAVYSTRFIQLAGLSSDSETVTVPAGRVYVVKQLSVYCNPTVDDIGVFFQSVGNSGALFANHFDVEHAGWVGFYGALTFLEGEGFRFHVDGVLVDSGADVYAGGYDLTSG